MRTYLNVKVRFEGIPHPMRLMKRDGKIYFLLREVSAIAKFDPWSVDREAGLFLDVLDDPAFRDGEIAFYGSVEGFLKYASTLFSAQAKAEEDRNEKATIDYGKQAERIIHLMAEALTALSEPENIL